MKLYLLLCFVLIWVSSEETLVANQEVSVSYLRQKLFENYDELIRPVKKQKTPTVVYSIISPLSIKELDEEKEILIFDTWIMMKWKDEYLTWDPSVYGNIEVFNLASSEIWLPDLTIYTGSPDEKMLFGVSTGTILNHTGDVIWVPPVTVHSRCPLDLTKYPYDVQTCVVKIGSWTYNGFMIDIQKYSEQIDFQYFTNNNAYWDLIAVTVERQDKYYPCCKEPYPALIYNVTLKRKPPSTIALAGKTSCFATFLALLMFWLPPDSMQKLILGAIAELILAVMVAYLGISIVSPVARLKAANGVYMSMCAVAGAMILETFIINLGRTMGPCRPPRFLLRTANGCCRTFCVCISRPYPGGDLVESTNSHKIKKRIPSAQEEWNLVAMAFDRILFFVSIIGCVVIHKIW